MSEIYEKSSKLDENRDVSLKYQFPARAVSITCDKLENGAARFMPSRS
jgi:hypothetical protein